MNLLELNLVQISTRVGKKDMAKRCVHEHERDPTCLGGPARSDGPVAIILLIVVDGDAVQILDSFYSNRGTGNPSSFCSALQRIV